MKRKSVVILSVVAAVALMLTIGGYAVVKSLERGLEGLLTLEIDDVDLSDVPDGAYRGSFEMPPVAAEVEVTVKSHAIFAIRILKHSHGRGAAAEAITDEVVRSGSLSVDAVSGATYSSKVILKAVQNALLEAKNR